jgi:aryl-alcohol dehydrogenase-like predicted oxidoreductase
MSGCTSFDNARGAVQCALAGGVNLIDTAPNYGDSEEVLGRALEGVTQPLFLSTKLGGHPKPFDPKDRDCLLKSVEESLRLLKRDHIDILIVHEPDDPSIYDWWPDPERFTGPITEVLDELRSQGIISFIGLGGVTAYALAPVVDSGAFDVVLTAFNYDVLYREAVHEILPAAARHDVGVILGSPLHQGVLATRHDDKLADPRALCKPRREQFQALYALLDETGMALPELGLRFALSNPQISTVLTGASNAEQMQSNLDAVEKGPLDEGLIQRLDTIADMVPFRPQGETWIPFRR